VFKSVTKILAAGLLLAPMSALATPIRVDFSIVSNFTLDGSSTYNGYAVGSVGTGWFTFDDAVGNFVQRLDVLRAQDHARELALRIFQPIAILELIAMQRAPPQLHLQRPRPIRSDNKFYRRLWRGEEERNGRRCHTSV